MFQRRNCTLHKFIFFNEIKYIYSGFTQETLPTTSKIFYYVAVNNKIYRSYCHFMLQGNNKNHSKQCLRQRENRNGRWETLDVEEVTLKHNVNSSKLFREERNAKRGLRIRSDVDCGGLSFRTMARFNFIAQGDCLSTP